MKEWDRGGIRFEELVLVRGVSLIVEYLGRRKGGSYIVMFEIFSGYFKVFGGYFS